jgi:hypothetical protein
MADLDVLLRYLKDHGPICIRDRLERIRVHGSSTGGELEAAAARHGAPCCRASRRRNSGRSQRPRSRLRLRPDGVARFRANFLWQENGPGAVFRIIPEIVSLDKLTCRRPSEAGEIAQSWCWSPPTGRASRPRSRPSSDQPQPGQAHRHHRGPVEFVHQNHKSVMSPQVRAHQRLRAGAARRHCAGADVIWSGDARPETISMAITAAEMGAGVRHRTPTTPRRSTGSSTRSCRSAG